MPAELRDDYVEPTAASSSVPTTPTAKDREKTKLVKDSPMDKKTKAKSARGSSSTSSESKLNTPLDFNDFVRWYYGRRILQQVTNKRFFTSSMANAAALAVFDQKTVHTMSE